MKNLRFIALVSILACLLIVIPAGFAVDNETAIAINGDNLTDGMNDDILADDYYFDSANDNNGDGSQYDPYKSFNKNTIKDFSVNYVSSGEYDFNGAKTISDATIIGDLASNTIIKRASLTVDTQLTVYNVTFIDSSITNRGELNLYNCIFRDSSSTMYGGAISSTKDVTIDNCTFLNNNASCGGAVYVKGGSLNIINSYFKDNYAELFGGAILAVSTNTNISNTDFRNNKVDYNGGAVYSYYGDIIVTGSVFANNSADNGGALYINNVDCILITDNNFTDNFAKTKANSIFSFYNSNSTIRNNSYPSEDELYETSEINMFIGGSDYTLYHYDEIEITDIPSRYDLRELGYVTPVKSQGKNGNCWAFATMATLESNILRALGDEYDLSESNLKNLFMKYGDYGWTLETNTGGYASMGYNYLVSWLGPVLEIDDPYIVNNLFSRVMNSILHVQNVLFIQRTSLNETNEVKKLIMTYGAVYSQIQSTGNRYQYYNADNKANHAISIVGWDDDLEFKGAPGKGGWIYKNSWGPNSGDHGYYYVSYYDTSCLPIGKTDGAFVFILNDTIKFDKNYQYDIQGKSDFFLNSSSSVWYKNIFTATDDEYLTAVSTIFEKVTNYTFSVYVNDEFKLTQSGSSKPGYYTFNLKELIPLKEGDKFEIVFNITVDGEAGFPISESVSFNKRYYTENTSFMSYDGENWTDLYMLAWKYSTHTYNSQVACIKAFTILNPISNRIELSIDNVNDTSLDLIATVYNEWEYPVENGNIIFNIAGDNYTVAIEKGIAKLTNVSLKAGVNNFTAIFNRTGYAYSTNFILFSKMLTQTNITFNELSQHNVVNISAIVTDLNGTIVDYGIVIFNIEGINHTVSIQNGVACINYTFSKIGLNNITAYYIGEYIYGSSNATVTLDILLIDTELTLNVSSEYNPVTITASIVDIHGNRVNSGKVVFTVDGKQYSANVSQGIAQITYAFAKAGLNDIEAVYIDDNNIHNSSNAQKSFNISMINTKLEIIAPQYSTNPVEITVMVKDQYDNPVNVGEVTFNLNGISTSVKVENGMAKYSHVFTQAGNNSINVHYNDDSYQYNSSDNASYISISKIKLNMTLEIRDNIEITVGFNQSISEYVSLLIDNKVYRQKINSDKAVFTFNNLKSRTHTVTAFLNSNVYECDNRTGEFYFYYTSNITADDYSSYFGNEYSVILDGINNNNPIKNKEIQFIINNQVYKNITDSSGVCMINLPVGKYNMTIKFNGDEDYLPCSVTRSIEVKSTINSGYEVKTLNSIYEFELLDKNGNALNNTNVTLKINSKTYELACDENGTFRLNVDLTPGSYNIQITNPATNESKTQNIKVVARITDNKNLDMYYGAGKYYTVKVLDDNGNIAKGVKVKFTINGKSYTKTTDSKGYASIKISQKPGTYTVTVEYKGYKVSNKVKVKTTLITKNMSFKKGKTIKFTAKLLNSKGKVLKNKKVTFKFKGKTYKIKTNKKGIATLKITKKYKVGKYTITSKYGSLSVKNTIKIKK